MRVRIHDNLTAKSFLDYLSPIYNLYHKSYPRDWVFFRVPGGTEVNEIKLMKQKNTE